MVTGRRLPSAYANTLELLLCPRKVDAQVLRAKHQGDSYSLAAESMTK